jgi:GT2 family glycosyltransferase/glycosyltransferase involved in cell wall biosynthesis
VIGGVLRQLAIGDSLGMQRGEVVVCIPVYGQHELVERCVASVLAHTPSDVTILVADDASPDGATKSFLELNSDPRIRYLRQPRNVGFVENVNAVFTAAAPADVVILNSDCEVGPEWLERLRAAAYSDSLVATATALTNHGTIVSMPREGPSSELPSGRTVEEVARAVAASSLRLRPRIVTAIGHCMWVRRSALDLIGGFDTAFSPGYGEEVDFSQRCSLRGLSHVAADDVFVFHRGGSSFDASPLQRAHERLLASRYPYYPSAVRSLDRQTTGPLVRSLAIARAAIEGLSVTIDARCLGPTVTGTQIHVLELIHALHRSGRVAHLRAVVPAGIGAWFLDSLRRLDGLEILVSDELSDGRKVPRSLLVHRPYQVFDIAELDLLARLGERFVVTHQDLISYRNPGYARSFEDWDAFHRLTRLSLALADEVLFFSHHAAADALAEELVDERRAHVAHLGVDHQAAPEESTPTRPTGLPEPADDAFLLCIGTNFRHKNRVFALDLLDALRNRRGWSGSLVFAGPHATAGTSEDDEAQWLAAHPETARFVADLGEVSDAEKSWLLKETRAVVYPSVYEGFGLVPFEAAAHGTPCVYGWHTALCETLPEHAATIVPWDAAATAARVHELLVDPVRAQENVAVIAAAARALTWDATAQRVLAVYDRAVHAPDRTAVTLAVDVGSPAALGARLAGRSIDRLDLPEDVYRAFRALVARPRLRRVFFAMLRAIHLTGYFVRHRRRPPAAA